MRAASATVAERERTVRGHLLRGRAKVPETKGMLLEGIQQAGAEQDAERFRSMG